LKSDSNIAFRNINLQYLEKVDDAIRACGPLLPKQVEETDLLPQGQLTVSAGRHQPARRVATKKASILSISSWTARLV
jgi:hypothetical protein